MRIYDQAGTLLLGRDTFTIDNILSTASGITFQGITHTSSGVKMLLKNQFSQATAVYSLPGVLPCSQCDGGVISGIQPNPSSGNNSAGQLPVPYPNPTNSNTTIPYSLPAGVNTGTLIVYDIIGQEVKRYTVTSSFSSIIIDAGEFAAGTYTYALETTQGVTAGNKFVVGE